MRVHEINGEDICGTSLLDRAHRGWGVSLGSAGASPRRCHAALLPMPFRARVHAASGLTKDEFGQLLKRHSSESAPRPLSVGFRAQPPSASASARTCQDVLPLPVVGGKRDRDTDKLDTDDALTSTRSPARDPRTTTKKESKMKFEHPAQTSAPRSLDPRRPQDPRRAQGLPRAPAAAPGSALAAPSVAAVPAAVGSAAGVGRSSDGMAARLRELEAELRKARRELHDSRNSCRMCLAAKAARKNTSNATQEREAKAQAQAQEREGKLEKSLKEVRGKNFVNEKLLAKQREALSVQRRRYEEKQAECEVLRKK